MTIKPFFQPSWPQSLPQEVITAEAVMYSTAHLLFSIIFIPYGIYRAVSAGVAKLASVALYPTPWVAYFNEKHRRETKEQLRNHHNGMTVPLKTADGLKIDNMLFRGEQKKAVIYCTGRGECYDSKGSFEYINGITKRVGDINLFLLNPRGVGDSEGTSSPEGFALDIYSCFKYLVEVEGISAEDIVIYGYSLGGGYGALGAELIQKEFPDAKINILNERSFSSLEEEVRQIFMQKFASYPLLASIVSKIFSMLLVHCEWEIDTERAASSLKGKVCVVYNKVDETIPFLSSLYSRMKQLAKENLVERPIRCVKLLTTETINAISAHARILTPWEEHEVANELKRMLNLQAEEPIHLRHVKELGSERSAELQGPDKAFHCASHAARRLHEYLQRAPQDADAMTNQMMLVLHGVETEALLSRHFQQQDAALARSEEPLSIDVSPQAVKAFYLRVLSRARASILLEQLEKKVREHGVQEPERKLLKELEQLPLSPEDAQALGLTNLSHRLYGEYFTVHEELRRSGIAWPAPQSCEFGRQGFNAQIPIPNIVRIRAL